MSEEIVNKLCPKGHPVGTVFRTRRCSGKSCGEVKQAEVDARPQAFIQKLSAAETLIQKRSLLSGVPVGLKGEEAKAWAEQKLQDMLPDAVAQLNMDLMFGTDKVKSEAAEKVLRANGMDKREASVGRSQPTIILNIGGDTKVSAPWLERMKK